VLAWMPSSPTAGLNTVQPRNMQGASRAYGRALGG